MAFKKKLKKIVKKVNKAVASALSAPSRAKSRLKGALATRKTNVFKLKKSFKGAPSFKNGKHTDAGKVRSVAAELKAKIIKKNKKRNKKN